MEFTAKADIGKNRLYIRLDGFPSLAMIQTFKADLTKELAKMRPGFTMLSDARGFKPADPALQGEVAGIMKMIAERQPSKVARIAGAVAGMQLGRIGKEAGYEAATFAIVADGEKFLDS